MEPILIFAFGVAIGMLASIAALGAFALIVHRFNDRKAATTKETI